MFLRKYTIWDSYNHDECRIGTEHEKFAFYLQDCTRATYEDIEHVLSRLVSRFGWQPMMEGDKMIGCKMNGQSVTLEPGGQFELSGAPLANLHQTCNEVNSHLYQAKAISEEVGVGFLGMGFDPRSYHKDVPLMPKERYKIMRQYMPKKGELGLDMMFRSCTIQVCVDVLLLLQLSLYNRRGKR
jgi:glutamate--cysteine ligase